MSTRRIAVYTVVALALFLAGSAGMAYVAGLHGVRHAVAHARWPWLALTVAGVAVGFAGYGAAYAAIGRVERQGTLEPGTLLALVAFGFGGFFARGGGSIDRFGLRAAGASPREASVRVTLLDGLEHGILALPCLVAAVVLLATSHRKPPLDFQIPWIVGPVLGFALAFWASRRWRDAWRERDGWHGKVAILLDAIHLVGVMFTSPRRHGPALAGMLVYWLADMLALWAAIRAFGFDMNFASSSIAFGIAMIVTRRTGPFGGAGLLDVALPPTLWQAGAPWPVAFLGTFAFRACSLALPYVPALLSLPRLRELSASAARR